MDELSVSAAVGRVRGTLDGIEEFSFTGEVVDVSPARYQGAVYAVLADPKNKSAVIDAFIPLACGRKVRSETDEGTANHNPVAIGQVLRVRGTAHHHDSKSSWNFKVTDLELVEALGSIERTRREDLERFCRTAGISPDEFAFTGSDQVGSAWGWPRNVIVVTSTNSDGYGDFCKALGKKRKFIDVVPRDVPVQGEQMVREMCACLAAINEGDADLVFILRGGGGWADLHHYDDVRLAHAVRDCPLHVITAVGHKADIHLVDYAADFACITPTEAARACREANWNGYKQANPRRTQKKSLTRPNAGGLPAQPLPRSSPPTPVPATAVPSGYQQRWTPSVPPARTYSPPTPVFPPAAPRYRRVELDWVSITAFILALTCVGPVALVLGLIGLSRTRHGQRSGRWAAVTATIVGTLTSLALVISAVGALENAHPPKPRVGQCVTRMGNWHQITRSATRCHSGDDQVVARGRLTRRTLRALRHDGTRAFCRTEIAARLRRTHRGSKLRVVIDTRHRPRRGDQFACIAPHK